MMRLFGQMMKLPYTALVFSLEMFVKTMQGLQRMADQSIDVLANGEIQPFGDAPNSTDSFFDEVLDSMSNGTVNDSAETFQKEEVNMSDTYLSDDMVKLVQYKVWFAKRDYEVVFPEVNEVVIDNMTDTSYIAWKIAEFAQNLEETEVPKEKWGGSKDEAAKPKYPKHAQFINGRWVIHKLDEEDKKYLRVTYKVEDRQPREIFKHQERQIEVLEEIRDKIRI